MLPAKHLLLPAAGCCWLVRAAAGCYLLPAAACCCLVVKVAVQHLFFPYALPLASAGVSELLLFFPGSCVINSFSLTHSPLRLPGSADIEYMGRYSCFDPFHSVFESHSSVDGCWRGSPLQHPLCPITGVWKTLSSSPIFPSEARSGRFATWCMVTAGATPAGQIQHWVLSIIVSPCFPYCLV